MNCPSCHAESPDAAAFCGECGARLSAACPGCGATNPPTNKFCHACGTGLAAAPATPPAAPTVPPPAVAEKFASPVSYTPKHLAEKILTSKGAMEGERKGVTVMFSDVSGFTSMSEKLDPEEVHAIMDRAFEVILNEVHRYEGSINQFLGDGVMALFGAPVAHEDHAHRALSAALAIQSGLKPLAEDVRRMHGVEFRMRMGINTGLVVVGAIGKDLRMDYTAVGDTTNLAARLLGIAKPGQIVVGRRTQHLREGFFVFEDLGDFQVKGKTEPVRAYAVSSEISGRTRLEVSRERGLTPLVGRDQELKSLAGIHRRAADGQGAIAVLVGDPGVGKSRLLYEFLHRLEAEGVLELETTCASYGRSMAYRPIVELLRRYLGLSDGISGDEIRNRVAEQHQFLGLEGEERSILLAHFLGVSAPLEFLNRLSGPQLKERTLGVLRDVFLRASELAPLILIVENMHWIDTASEEFLAHLAAGLPGHRTLLVLTTRPGYAAPWLAPPLAETIALEGLGAGDVRGMVRTLLAAEEISEQLFKILAEKCEGNPLYVEEILRQLQETGGIAVEGGEARLSRADVTVPATIHDIIAARVDRLAEPLKQTLQGAAVVGRRFGISLVSRILEVVPDQVAGHLRELHGLDFVFPSAQEPELMFSFKHALTQDVVYAGVLERRRRTYHAAAGLGLEDLYAGRIGDVVELVAYHYGRSAEAEKAVDYAILAAEKAQRRWANTEALVQFEAALKRLETMPDTEPNRLRRIDGVVKQAEIKFALGRHAEQVQALEGIKHIVETAADPPRRAAWYSWAGFLHHMTGTQLEVPIAYCRHAAEIADAAGLTELRAFAECSLTHVFMVAGNLRGAVEVGERALGVFESRGNIWWACRTLWGLSGATNLAGEWRESLEYCHRALEHGQAANDLRLKTVGWWRTALTNVERGDVENGLRCCEEALALSPIPFDLAMTRAVRGCGRIKAGDATGGMAELQEALEWLGRSHLSYQRARFALWLADGHLRGGEPSQARGVIEEVLGISHEFHYRRVEGEAERLLGESLIPDNPTTAADHLATAMGILEEVGARNELAKALAARGELHRATGDFATARKLLDGALRIFEELGTIDEPPRVRAALAALDDNSTT
jgi:class 3 adenylate cyclase/tetratricopeptide (TPR) repeat protein